MKERLTEELHTPVHFPTAEKSGRTTGKLKAMSIESKFY